MNDQQLRRALRDLPRHRPADGFARRTLARLDESRAPAAGPRSGHSLGWTLGRAAAVAAMLVAAAVILTRLPVAHRQPAPDVRSTAVSAPAQADPGDLGAGRTAASADRSPERQAALRELRAERDRLAAELDALKRQFRTGTAGSGPSGLGAAPGSGNEARFDAPSGDPVLYLGGDDRVDLVLDLGRLAAERGGGAVPTARGGSS